MARTKARGNSTGKPKISETAQKEAWAAMATLKALMPQLRQFARIITGDQHVDVTITTNVPHTKGKLIHIRPPLGLGRPHAHNRNKCGLRGGDGKQLCEACRVREVIDFFLYHEIGHVVGKSDSVANWADLQRMQKFLSKFHPAHVCNHAEQVMKEASLKSIKVIQAAGFLSEFLPMLVNALEDARVNEKMFVARPGLRKVFEVNVDGIMKEGVDVGGGDFVQWNEAPLNSQFIIGVYTLAIGYQTEEGMYDPRVMEALADTELLHQASRATTARSINEVFDIALEVLFRAQDLGFLEVPRCTLPPPSLGNPGGSSSQPGSGDSESDSSGDDGSADRPSGDSDGQVDESGDQSSGSDGGSTSKSEHSEDDPHAASDSGDSDGGNEAGSESGDSSLDSDNDRSSNGVQDPTADSDADSKDDSSKEEVEDESDGTDDSSTATGQPGDSTPSDDAGEDDQAADSADGTGCSGDLDKDEPAAGSDESELEQDSTDSGSDSDSKGSGSKSDHEPVQSEASEGQSSDDPAGSSGSVEAESDGSSEPDEGTDGPEDGTSSADDGSVEDSDLDGDEILGDDPEGYLEEDRDVWNDGQADAENDYVHDAPPPEQDASALLPDGDADDAARALARFLMHGVNDEDGMLDHMADGEFEKIVGITEDGDVPQEVVDAVRMALRQAAYFDDMSVTVSGVEMVPYPMPALYWDPEDLAQQHRRDPSNLFDIFAPSEKLIGSALLHMRRVLDENKRSRKVSNLKKGRLNTRALGRRAPLDDPRVFAKKITPAKRDYSVVIGLDGSGSTASYDRNEKIKRMAHAQADILSRLGIPFAIYTHTAYTQQIKDIGLGFGDNYWVYMLPIKEFNEPWNDHTKTKLAAMQAMADNLDGHSLEFYRKMIERREETDRILLYVTDGQMPAANYTDERNVLEREVKVCARKKITLLGVGINTDSPKEYGMETVRVDSDEDIHKVIDMLDRRLTK